jgi:hypothetical protein
MEAIKSKYFAVEFDPRVVFSQEFYSSWRYDDTSLYKSTFNVRCDGHWLYGRVGGYYHVKAGTVVDYDWFVALTVCHVGISPMLVPNPVLVELALRGFVFVYGEFVEGGVPASGDVMTVESDGKPLMWAPIAAWADDVASSVYKSFPLEDQERFKAEAKAFFAVDRRDWVEKGYDAINEARRG